MIKLKVIICIYKISKRGYYMRQFDYREKWTKLLTPDIVSLLTTIHELKGEQTFFIEAKADTLTQLTEVAKIQSTDCLLYTS